LNAIADFGIVSGLLPKEKASESQAWTTDLEQFADDTNMEETLVGLLKAERRAWRDGLILLRLTAMKKNMEVFCDASTLLSAVETHGQLKLECPHHFHLLEVLTTSMFTSVSPERGFSWLKRFLTRLSQGMGELHLDNCMQVAMNAPADDTDDSDFCERVVIKFCAKRNRHLDSPNYNDEPKQKTEEARPRAKGKREADACANQMSSKLLHQRYDNQKAATAT
jgi:hypothetical protein